MTSSTWAHGWIPLMQTYYKKISASLEGTEQHDKDMEVTYVLTDQVEPPLGNGGIHTSVWMKNMDHDKNIRKVFRWLLHTNAQSST
jgi:hypothetical protein